MEEYSPNNDGRKEGEWKSRYPMPAWIGIIADGLWILLVSGASGYALFAIWNGTAYKLLSQTCSPSCGQIQFTHFAYLIIGGVLGGLIFGIKYFYKVVAHGYWNQDRIIWRLLSPFLSAGLALGVGALVQSGIMVFTIKNVSSTSFFSIGFITGYFADSAVAKLQSIAMHLFGQATDP